MYKNYISLKLMIIIFLAGVTENNTSHEMPYPQPTQEELEKMLAGIDEEMLIGMMQEVVEQYSNWSEEEKEAMCKESNLKREDLEKYIAEAKNEIEHAKTELEKKKKTKEIQTKNEEPKITPTQPEIIQEKKQIQKYLNQIQRCIQTLDMLQLKSQDEMIKNIISVYNEELSGKIEILNYYFKIFYDFLHKQKEENKINIENKKIEEVIDIIIQINELEPTIERLITFEEFQENNAYEDLFQKYQIKPNQEKELKEKLETEIVTIETKIEELEKSTTLDKKEKKTKIAELEYKLNIIENDLTKIETTKTNKKNNNEKLKEFKEKLENSIEKIVSKFNNILEKSNGISKIENFIKEYFPKEYNIGKEKEKIQKEIKKKEDQITNQKGSKSELYNEKINSDSKYLKNKKYGNEKENDIFNYNTKEDFNDYNNQDIQEENKDKNEAMNSDNESKKNGNVSRNGISGDRNPNKEENLEEKTPIEEKNSLRTQKGKKRKTREKNQAKETTESIIEKILLDIEDTKGIINNFFIHATKTKVINESAIQNISQEITNKIEQIKAKIKTLTEEQIKKNKTINISLNKISEKEQSEWPAEILKKESQKINLINEIKKELKKPIIENFENQDLEILQIIFYKIETINETFNKISNNFLKELAKESINGEKETEETKNREQFIKNIESTTEKAKQEILYKISETQRQIINQRKDPQGKNISNITKYTNNNQFDFWIFTQKEVEEDLATLEKEKEKK